MNLNGADMRLSTHLNFPGNCARAFQYYEKSFVRRKLPVISVDTKKKELVGDFKNGGRELRPKGHPAPVRERRIRSYTRAYKLATPCSSATMSPRIVISRCAVCIST